ncbi:MAG: HAMP domain-containing histidine kinase [Betaproteobacteria bacterium]|nr:HAMP domain-containing histidine kinase [Betaproteobacteria bacterium]
MFRSLRGRLIVLLVLLVVAAGAAGTLMVGLFRQSATAQVGRAEAEVGRACDAITDAYRFYSSGWQDTPVQLDSDALRHDLTAVVQTALRDRPRIEGGIWQADAGSLAYAFPTYQGSGPKTDVPQAELPRIQAVNQAALANERQASSRYDAPAQVLLLTACPLPGPIPNLTAWAMTRVATFAGDSYRLLMTGLGVLFAAVLAAAALLGRLTMTWSRHVARIESALQTHDIAGLPALPATGERELDRIVMALNDAGQRLAEARRRADELARQVATGERLAAIGRVAAGVAHEIRNPIGAMRLKAENALAGDEARKNAALTMMLAQIERLDALVRRLLSMAEREKLHCAPVALPPFLESCLTPHRELARAKGVTLECVADDAAPNFDAEQMRRALDNLVLNAIAAAPAGSAIAVAARRDGEHLVISVHDEGPGPDAAIREHLFEPFVTGRADGAGLGLSIVREVAATHDGSARLGSCPAGTVFEMVLPWR